MTDTEAPAWVWIDLETTGLNPDASVLEVGMMITNADLGLTTSPFHRLVLPPLRLLRGLQRRRAEAVFISEPVITMHERSLLTQALTDRYPNLPTVEQVEAEAVDWLTVNGATGLPAAGSTVSKDREWLRHSMPKLDAALHYRSVDVSTVKELARRWAPHLVVDTPAEDKAHRPLEDLYDSIKELARYHRSGFLGLPPDRYPPTT